MSANTKEVVYRKATLKDLEELCRLSKLQQDFHKNYSWYYKFKKNYMKDTKKFVRKGILSKKEFVMVAQLGNSIGGYIHASIKPGIPIFVWKNCLWINDIFVKKSLRGKGVGKSLFNKSIDFGLKKGVSFVKLQTDSKNMLAENFYKSRGMELLDKVWIFKVGK